MAVWNVRGINHKLDELQMELREKRHSYSYFVGEVSTEIEHYLLIYSGVLQDKSDAADLAIIINKKVSKKKKVKLSPCLTN
jgi:chorismate synthase